MAAQQQFEGQHDVDSLAETEIIDINHGANEDLPAYISISDDSNVENTDSEGSSSESVDPPRFEQGFEPDYEADYLPNNRPSYGSDNPPSSFAPLPYPFSPFPPSFSRTIPPLSPQYDRDASRCNCPFNTCDNFDNPPDMRQNNEYINAQDHQTYFQRLNNWMATMKSYCQEIALNLDRQFQRSTNPNNLHEENLMVECKSAPIWKRVLAEFIDGFIIFQLKFYIVLLLQNYLNYNLKDYADFLENPAIFQTITSGIALMDLASRFVNFVYEAYFIWKDGATPGKRVAGLKVYSVEVVVPTEETGRVKVYPCNQVQLSKALLRSFLKSIGLFIFLYGFFISNFTRAGHDLVAKTLVVDESVPIRNRPNFRDDLIN